MAPRPDDPDEPTLGRDEDAPGPDPEHADSTEPVDDDVWAAIVAQLSDVEAGDAPQERAALDFPVAPWVATEGVERPTDERGAVARDWDGTSQYDAAESAVDEAEGFVPPDPGPVLGGDPLLTMAWLAAGGMPVLVLALLVFWPGAPAALVQAACVVFVLGVAVLLWRMPGRRDPGDDDTGAVV